MNGYIGLDLGGTGAKAAVYNDDGKLLGSGQSGFLPVTNADGDTSIPINDIYVSAKTAVKQAVSGCDAIIRAMSISSQGQTFVSLDEYDKPIHDAIMWYDSRAQEESAYINEKLKNIKLTCPPPFIEPIASAPKILWLKNRFPLLMSRASKYLLLPEFFNYILTGHSITDPCTASSTGLYADDAFDYSHEAINIIEIDISQVAQIKASGSPVGIIKPEIAMEWNLPNDTMIVVGTNDQYAGALGAGNTHPGILTETTGTCLALVTLTKHLPDPMPAGLFGGRFPIQKYQFALAYSKTAGVALDWYKKTFCVDRTFDELNSESAKSPIGSNGITFLPHFDGSVSPKPNPNTKGFICNLSLNHTSSDIYRSILESISFSLRENIDFLKTYGFNIDIVRSIGGGAKSDLWLQMKADVINLPVEKPVITEAATLGAAMLAAVGYGTYSSVEECSENFYHVDRIFYPNVESHLAYNVPYARYSNLCKLIYSL